MKEAAGRTRLTVALALVLVLGSFAQLPHRHAEAEAPDHAPPGQTELIGSGAVGVEDDAECPACVLQRLLNQTVAARPSALEKPAAVGTVALPRAVRLVQGASWLGSPRAPPPSA